MSAVFAERRSREAANTASAGAAYSDKLSFVVVTYNGLNYVDDCLRSIESQRLSPLEIVVVDNNSSDGTDAHVEQEYPHLKLLRNRVNVGYGRACNQGARHSRGDFIAFVNQDVNLASRWAQSIMGSLSEDIRCGAVEGKLLLTQRRGFLNCRGSYLNYLGFGCATGSGEPDVPEFAVRRVSYPSGAAFVVRRRAFESVGGFDESFFLYHDDVDLGLRLQRAGWSILYSPTSIAYHDFQSGLRPDKVRLLEQNRWRTLIKNMPAGYFLRCAPILAAVELGILLYSAGTGLLRSKVQAWLGLFKEFQETLQARSLLNRATRSRTPLEGLTSDFPSLLPVKGRLMSLADRVQRGYFRAFLKAAISSPAESAG